MSKTVGYWIQVDSQWAHRSEIHTDEASADQRYRELGELAMHGGYAEMALWDVALSAEDIARLAKGCSALHVRPDALVEYVPAIPVREVRSSPFSRSDRP